MRIKNAATIAKDCEATDTASSNVVVTTAVSRKPLAKTTKQENNEDSDEPTTPTTLSKKKLTPEAKKGAAATKAAENGEVATEPKSSGKKRGGVKTKVGDHTPTKKQKVEGKATDGTAKRAKAPANKFPESQSEFSPQDKLIYEMRKAGKNFDEIAPHWTAMTGIPPGKDLLRKRYSRLAAVGKDWQVADVSFYLLTF